MGQLIVNGLTTGLILALPALALALSFSVLRFANYAIGSYVTVGAFLTWWTNVHLGLPLWAAAMIGSAAVAAIAVVIDILVYSRMRERSSLTLLVASMGVAITLENIVRLFAGNSPRSFDVPVARPYRLWDIRVNQEQLIILVTVPLSLCGALLPLALGFGTLNIYTQIGLLTLVGLISKHGILMVEFANELQFKEGLKKPEAILQAARIRLRPVLMTTGAMVFGLVPLLLAQTAALAWVWCWSRAC